MPPVSDEQNLRAALIEAAAKRGEISKIAKALSISPSTVSRWIEGEIPPPMAKLLNLYFFDMMPFDIAAETIIQSVLDFTEDQWKVICILAKRQGLTPGLWIANQIRAYLAMDDEARTQRANLEAQRRATNAGLQHLQELPKVAEDSPEYGGKSGNGSK